MKTEKTDIDFEKMRKDLTEAGRSIWLAGLGAVARAEEEGQEIFERFVERGRKVEKSQFKSIDRTVARTTDTLKDWSDKVQGTVRDGMKEVLHRVGMPSRQDLEHLSARINDLSKKVDQFAAQRQ